MIGGGRVKIGKYDLILNDTDGADFLTDDGVLIMIDGGEGGVFSKHELFKKLETVIDEFYEENF